MYIFFLFFISSFIALILTIVVMHIRKCIKAKDNVDKGGKQVEYVEYAPETQEKWKETLPKHSTRIKLRNSRKLRNKRKGKK